MPEHLRINAEKKRRQMVLLEESLYSIKMSFNDRFLALRDLKVRMKKNMDSWSDRIKEINEELDIPSEELWRPELPDSEFPEKRFEVSQSELEAETASGRATRAPPPATPAVVTSADASSSTGAGKAALGRPGEGGFGGGFLGGVKFPAGYEMSEVEKVEAHVRKVQLQYEKEKLVDMIEHTVEALDEAVRTLRQERFKLDVDLKMTDLRMLVLFQELKLLKDFEKRDTALVKKLDDKGQEKREMAVKMGECRDKIAARKLEIDKLNPKQVLTGQPGSQSRHTCTYAHMHTHSLSLSLSPVLGVGCVIPFADATLLCECVLVSLSLSHCRCRCRCLRLCARSDSNQRYIFSSFFFLK